VCQKEKHLPVTKKKQPQRRRAVALSHPQSLPIRMTVAHLARIDAMVRAATDPKSSPNRSIVVAALAARQALRILEGEPPPLLEKPLNFDAETTTVSISFSRKQELLIRRACDGLHQHFGPFVLWAVMSYLDHNKR
jgi:hypothetical protein